MLQHFRPALTLLIGFSLLTGIIYPLTVTGIAQLLWPRQAGGSLIVENGTVRGSTLIGQSFVSAHYFHGRPSAAGYDAAASSGSNLSPTSAKLQARMAQQLALLQAENPGVPVPTELLYSSASGLDPELSPAAASFQIARITKARGLGKEAVQALVTQHTRVRAAGFLGEPRVNVLALNRALDALKP